MMLYKQLKHLNVLPKPETLVVDIGCGFGKISLPFYEAGYNIVGIDIDQDRLATAQASMPNGKFYTQDLEDFMIPRKSFVIAKNSLPFLKSKEKAHDFLKKLENVDCFFSLFGEKDESVKGGHALSWTREEADSLMERMGNVILFTEICGLSVGLRGQPRQSHIFEILRIR